MMNHAAILTLMAACTGMQSALAADGLVFATTNDPQHNSLAVYTRSADGVLGNLRLIDSGGRGSLDKGRLIQKLRMSEAECDSLIDLVRSRLQVTVSSLLRATG